MKKLLALTGALLLLIGANTSFADNQRNGWNDHGRGSDRGWDRDWRGNDRGWDRGRNVSRWNDRRRDNVSVSLSFGNVWGSPYRDRSWTGVGFGYNTFDTWGYNDRRYINRRPVVVYQNNTYIEPASRTRVITRSNRSGTSLLRDIEGRCFERETDGNGNETRTELPASACNF